MFTPVTVLCQIVRTACISADVVIDIDKMRQNPELLNGASILTRSAIIALNIIDLSLNCSGNMTPTRGLNLKNVELISHAINFPIQFTKSMNALANNQIGIVASLETGVFNPFMSMLRTGIERDLYQERQYLGLSPEEKKQTQRPIYGVDYDGDPVIIGYKDIDDQECSRNIKELETALPTITIIEAASHVKLTKIYELIATRLFSSAQSRHNPPIAAPIPNAVPVQPNGNNLDLEQLFNLRRYRRIVPELHDDQIFSQYTCAITHEPIRYIVQDPTANVPCFYEREAITAWIRQRQNSPLTRQSLRVEELRERFDLQGIIDQRLQFHESQLLNAIQLNLNVPNPPAAPAPALPVAQAPVPQIKQS